MIVQQLSVFLENRPGQLSDFVHILAENQVDLQALSIAESQDYGVARIIVDRPRDTAALLSEHNWVCTVTPVLTVTVPDEPGSLTRILGVLAENEISLSYSYAFFGRSSGSATIVLRTPDSEKAELLLRKAGIDC